MSPMLERATECQDVKELLGAYIALAEDALESETNPLARFLAGLRLASLRNALAALNW